MSEFLRECCDCGTPFFTWGEKEFYASKALRFPTRCESCRELRKARRLSVLKDVADNWKLDAKIDDGKYFYITEETKDVFSGKKHFVIGRKGAGKTAVCGYLMNYPDPCVFTEKLSFKNFPFNVLYGCDNSKYTAPNQYITIWKYLIYSCICRMMVRNNAVDVNVRELLAKYYNTDPIKSLSRLVDKWTAKGFGVDIMGSGLNVEWDRGKDEATWIDKTNILEDIINSYLDDSKYFIVIDELDEDYRSFESTEQRVSYIYLLTSLFKAVQDIKSIFWDTKNICPVVFLRNDIYSLIKDSDKAKWSDYLIDIEWDIDGLKKMLANRITVATESDPPLSFDNAWGRLFDKSIQNTSFRSITKSTHFRPRDYVKYIQECAERALGDNHHFIDADDLRWADKAFSNYLRDEIVDEIHAILPDIDAIFTIISQIRKTIFTQKEFKKSYELFVEKGLIVNDKGYEYVLTQLFNISVLGNQSSKKSFFKYENKEARFNYNEDLIVHWGLHKALQLI